MVGIPWHCVHNLTIAERKVNIKRKKKTFILFIILKNKNLYEIKLEI